MVMRAYSAVTFALFLAVLLGMPLRAAADGPVRAVVELFTSKACPACPPADRYLAELATRPGVLALAWHVDYGGGAEAQDPFAASFATERQEEYARTFALGQIYTPQMIVNGTGQRVGFDRSGIDAMLRGAVLSSQAEMDVTPPVNGRLVVTIRGVAAKEATLWLVAYGASTGDDEGEDKRPVVHPVRFFWRVGLWRGGHSVLTTLLPQSADSGGSALILQEGKAGKILAVRDLGAY